MSRQTSRIGRTAIVFMIVVACFLMSAQALGSQKLLGLKPPVLVYKDNLGQEIKLNDGGIAIIYFWQTSCVPCSAMIPLLNSLFDAYGAKGLQIIGVGTGETVNSTDKYRKDKGAKYSLIPDPAGKVSIAYGISVTPSIYVVDSTGIISLFKTGYTPSLDDAYYLNNVKRLLGIQ
jgi:peroxiredoxin